MQAMNLDATACYRALAARDARFDGRFFVGVASTRIYCRPVCSARTPRRENCRFFTSAAAAECAGFRPCLRCRPELAPGLASVDSTARLAEAAVRLIEEGALEELGLHGLAARLGVSDRHMRRVFTEVLGVTPVAFAQTHRLLLAKRLLTDTRLPVTDVAFASGFQSLRRFNALFSARYRLAPNALRRDAARLSRTAPLRFELAYRPPYDWAHMLGFLAARAIDGVERVSGTRYVRTLGIEQGGVRHAGTVTVAPARGRAALKLELSPGLARVVLRVMARVRRAFDLECDPDAVNPVLADLAHDAPGVRVPGGFDGFEVAMRVVAGQQVSVAAARTLLSRIAAAYGEPLPGAAAGLVRTFPAPACVRDAGAQGLRALGVLPSRARTMVALAAAMADGALRLEPGVDVAATVQALAAIPGLGPWSAQMIAMRALGWPDAFPAGDRGLLRKMGMPSAAAAERASAAWQPWRSYAVMHLWRNA